MNRHILGALAASTALLAAQPAFAAKDPPPELVNCEASLGTIALVEGDTMGWTEWNLGSPRQLVNVLAAESGCFTPHNSAGGEAARYLVTIIAGSAEEVDQSISMAKSAASTALVHSGAAGSVISKVPFGGAALGMFGGFGGKKKTYSAGIRVVSPANGLTLASGTGTVKKSSLSFGGTSWAANAAGAAGYADSKEGQSLTEAFVIAFNNLIAQRSALETAPAASSSSSSAGAEVAVDTVLRALPAASSTAVRKLRAGTTLTPTGQRDGLFIEVTDSFGTKGWVSVEDLS